MVEKITVNSGKKFLGNSFACDALERGDLTALIQTLDQSSGSYCIVINILDNKVYSEQHRSVTKVGELLASLTSRETQVLQLAMEGCSNRDIAKNLFISAETVKSHRKNIVSKVGIRKVDDLKHVLYKSNNVQEVIFKNHPKG